MPNKISGIGGYHLHLENPDSFEIIRKIGSHLENPDSFEIIWKIGSHLENPDSFEIIRKIGYHLENPDSFEIIRKIGNHLEKIRTVLKPSRKLEIIWKNPDRFEFESIETV